MSVSAANGFSKLGYGSLYLPVLIYGYLYSQTEVAVVHFNQVIVTNSQLWILAFMSLLGAMLFHGIMRAIFGPEGPEQNPKYTWTVRYYLIALIQEKRPTDRPISSIDVFQRVNQGLSIRRLPRFMSFFSILLSYHLLSYYSLIPMVGLVSTGAGVVPGALFLAQLILLIKGLVWNRLPSVIPIDSFPWADTPEYLKIEILQREELSNEEISERLPTKPRGLVEELLKHSNQIDTSEIENLQSEPEDQEKSQYFKPQSNTSDLERNK